MNNNLKIREDIDDRKEKLVKFIDEKRGKGYNKSALMSVLHKAQEIYGFISTEVIEEISMCLGIPTASIWGVVTFYHFFTTKPRGKYIISVCLGTACYVRGSKRILNKLKEVLGIGLNETTKDRLFTLEAKYCLGCCGLSPVMMINDEVYEKLTTKKVVEIIKNLKAESEVHYSEIN
ncbi:MAG: NAD(P)H-dependent oxidoreductase subunit E [Actinomycetota bacterium]|nr:NAD(P)H-dependent oxidoreductase subunit E [Actinomycetota bacterium]